MRLARRVGCCFPCGCCGEDWESKGKKAHGEFLLFCLVEEFGGGVMELT